MTVVLGTAAAGVLIAVVLGEGGVRGRRVRHRSLALGASASPIPSRFAGVGRWGLGLLGGLLRPVDPTVATTDMVAFLDAVARGLRGGAGIHGAVRGAVRSGGVHAGGLTALVGSLDAGMPLAEALAHWRQSRPSPEVALAAAVLGFGLATGGSVARAVDGAAATLRERLALAGETRVLAVQARVSALVVGGAPLAFMVVVVLADPRVGGVLFGSWLGLVCLLIGGALELACVGWMRRLVAGAADS